MPVAVLAVEAAVQGSQLFCVGNPSRVDLESLRGDDIEFEPPVWHTSVGQCEGYMTAATMVSSSH